MVTKTSRNVLIILALAAVVVYVPGGGTGSAVVMQALTIVFLGSMAWLAIRLYREHRVAIFSLGEGIRAVGCASVGLAVLTVSATPRLWSSGSGTLVWFVLVGLASGGAFAVVRAAQRY